MEVECVNNEKCENFLSVGSIYKAKESETREGYYTVFVFDKKHRIPADWFDFRKHRFDIKQS